MMNKGKMSDKGMMTSSKMSEKSGMHVADNCNKCKTPKGKVVKGR